MKTSDKNSKALTAQEKRKPQIAKDQQLERSTLSPGVSTEPEHDKLAEENQLLVKKLAKLDSDLKALQSQHTLLQVRFLKTVQQRLDEQTSNITQSRRKIIELVGMPKRSAANK